VALRLQKGEVMTPVKGSKHQLEPTLKGGSVAYTPYDLMRHGVLSNVRDHLSLTVA
jgi:hypothetical protein